MTIAEIIEKLEAADRWLDEGCSRLTYGRCSTRACLKRGGWDADDGTNHDLATCPKYTLRECTAALRAREASDG